MSTAPRAIPVIGTYPMRMPDDWPARVTAEATTKVEAFLRANPKFARDGVEQAVHGGTNRVIFARRGGEVVVFKVFCETERKERECFGLRHWQQTGMVPELIRDVEARMIVMSYIPGLTLSAVREAHGEEAWRQACRETGRALGALTQVPLAAADRAAFESRFYTATSTSPEAATASLEAYLQRICRLGRGVQARDPDFTGEFWLRSLDLVEAEIPAILAQPRILYHQDVGNLHVHAGGGGFAGFFDLEMCRVGCAAMQLGSALPLLRGDAAAWALFRLGWGEAAGPLGPEECRSALAAWHLLCWREISRYLSYDGTPGTGFSWATPADPSWYRQHMEAMEHMLGI